MNDRRRFVRNFGLLGAVLAGMGSGELAAEPKSVLPVPDLPNPSSDNVVCDISSLQPDNTTSIVLSADNTGSHRLYSSPNSYTISAGYGSSIYMVAPSPPPVTNQVRMSVGKDNRLWIEVDGSWKRVALEG